MSDMLVEWGTPTATASGVHPIYFAKCLTKVITTCFFWSCFWSWMLPTISLLIPLCSEISLNRLTSSMETDWIYYHDTLLCWWYLAPHFQFVGWGLESFPLPLIHKSNKSCPIPLYNIIWNFYLCLKIFWCL